MDILVAGHDGNGRTAQPVPDDRADGWRGLIANRSNCEASAAKLARSHGSGAHSSSWLSSQNGGDLVRLQVQNSIARARSAVHSSGSKPVPSCEPSQNGCALGAAAAAPPVGLARRPRRRRSARVPPISGSLAHAAPSRFGREPRLAAGLGQFAHAQDVALPLGDRDHAARVEQIEDVARLDALVVGRQRHQVAAASLPLGRPAGVEIFPAGRLRHLELLEQHVGVGSARNCAANIPARPAGTRRRR